MTVVRTTKFDLWLRATLLEGRRRQNTRLIVRRVSSGFGFRRVIVGTPVRMRRRHWYEKTSDLCYSITTGLYVPPRRPHIGSRALLTIGFDIEIERAWVIQEIALGVREWELAWRSSRAVCLVRTGVVTTCRRSSVLFNIVSRSIVFPRCHRR